MAFGSLAKTLCPNIEIGDTAIFHHAVEYKSEDTSENNGEGDTRLVTHDEIGNDIRVVYLDEHPLTSELFGIFKNGTIYPARGIIFCYPQVFQSKFQLSANGIYSVLASDLSIIEEELKIQKHGIHEMSRVLHGLGKKTNENMQLFENTEKALAAYQEAQRRLNKRKQQIVLAELVITDVSTNTPNLEVVPGDTIFVDMSKLYPLNLIERDYSLIRLYEFIYAKKVGEEIVPLNDYVIIKQDDRKRTIGSIILPKNIGEKPNQGVIVSAGIGSEKYPMEVKKDDKVLFYRQRVVEIFINGKAHIIVHSQNLICKL